MALAAMLGLAYFTGARLTARLEIVPADAAMLKEQAMDLLGVTPVTSVHIAPLPTALRWSLAIAVLDAPRPARSLLVGVQTSAPLTLQAPGRPVRPILTTQLGREVTLPVANAPATAHLIRHARELLSP